MGKVGDAFYTFSNKSIKYQAELERTLERGLSMVSKNKTKPGGDMG